MHHFVIVFSNTKPTTESVAAALSPHQEDPETSLGYWDWYSIGGRWSGVISGTDMNASGDFFHQYTEEARALGPNTARVSDLLEHPGRARCAAFVTAEGELVADQTWDGERFIPHPNFEAALQAYLQEHPDQWAVGVDCHS